MFDKIGGKIKKLAITICIVGMLAGFVGGLVLIINEEFIWGAAIIVFSVMFSWIGVFCLYGFGQLIENSDTMIEQNDTIIGLLNKESATEENKDDKIDADNTVKLLCPYCKEKLIVKKEIIDDGCCKECPYCHNIIDFS